MGDEEVPAHTGAFIHRCKVTYLFEPYYCIYEIHKI
jgi:hypothetical protein